LITVVVYVRKGDSGGVGDRGLSWARLGQRLSRFASGFFGIGGGSSWCPVCSLAPASTSSVVGVSLISAGTFGMMTAATYMWRGFVEPVSSMLRLVGGTAGGYISARIAY
jgi:uncharacterized membrane protein YfcA